MCRLAATPFPAGTYTVYRLRMLGVAFLFFLLRPAREKGTAMARRTRLYLPALIVAAAVLIACAAAVLAVSREAEATFPGKNGKIAYVAWGFTSAAAEIYTINP